MHQELPLMHFCQSVLRHQQVRQFGQPLSHLLQYTVFCPLCSVGCLF